ncbi:hypothetical protein ACOCJ5_08375 [Knoellia sp. CPCC 206450]|uniref:hypothetical protein n=1 Tax=Knoellia tibetensis TaxID=3404798 RepID=UPI003B43BB77
MAVLARALGIGMAAALAFALLMMGDDGEGGANIGAGLAVFAAVAVGSFGWALLDGLGRTGTLAWFDSRGDDDPADGPTALRPLLVRWALVSLLLVVLVQALRAAASNEGLVENEVSTMLFLLLLAAGPALAGTLLGWAARRAQTGSNRPPVTR